MSASSSPLLELTPVAEFGGYRLLDVYRKTTPEIRSLIIQMWRWNGALPEGVDIEARVHQVALVVANEEGLPVGVTTLYPAGLDHIGRDDPAHSIYLYYRMYITPRARGAELMRKMAFHTFEIARGMKLPGNPRGMIAVAENRKLEEKGVQALFMRHGGMIDGRTPQGFLVYRRDF